MNNLLSLLSIKYLVIIGLVVVLTIGLIFLNNKNIKKSLKLIFKTLLIVSIVFIVLSFLITGMVEMFSPNNAILIILRSISDSIKYNLLVISVSIFLISVIVLIMLKIKK